jgi:hypothetical protein
MTAVVNEEQMLQLGLEIGGFGQGGSLQTDMRRFRDLYGGHPKATAAVFRDLQTIDMGDAKIVKISLQYFLMALYYLRGYGIENRVMVVFGLKCPKTFRHHIWTYLKAMQALKAEKVSIEL